MTLIDKTYDRFIDGGPVPIAVLFIEHPSQHIKCRRRSTYVRTYGSVSSLRNLTGRNVSTIQHLQNVNKMST